MPKDSEMTLQDSGMSLRDLYNLLRDVLSKNPSKDKSFLKNELKIKPLIEVSKHSFDDGCSPLAIVDFKVLQGAYQHYLENPDCLTQKLPIRSSTVSDKNDEWKDSVFISRRDSNAAGTSEDSDLEKALCDLQMSTISNDISDPEVLDFCNKEFARKSLFNSTVPVTDLSPSVSFSHLQNTVAVESVVDGVTPQDLLLNVELSEKLDVPHIEEKDPSTKTKILKDIRRKKTQYGKRKKCKKKNNVLKSILVRNVNSTDSSEMLSPPSETQLNNLATAQKDLCASEEELNQNGLSTQEQEIDSTVLISPKNKIINKSTQSSTNKIQLRKKSKPTVKTKLTQKCQVSTQSSKDISKLPNPTKSLHTSKFKDSDKNRYEVLQTSEKILPGPQDVFRTSVEEANEPSQSPKAVLQNQSPTISSQVVERDGQRTSEMVHKSPKKHSVVTEMLDKLVNNSQTLKAKSPESKSNSKEDSHRTPCDIAKDSLSLQNEAIKCDASVTEKENDDVFEKDHHITRSLSDSGYTESEKDMDKNSNISISPLDHANYNIEGSNFFTEGTCSTENQHSSHPENQQEVDDYDNLTPGVPSKTNVKSPAVASILDDVLDYECDEISELEDDPVTKSPEEDPFSYSGDEDVHSTEDYSCYSEVTGGDTPGQEICPTSDVISGQLVESAPSLKGAECNNLFKDISRESDTGVTKDEAQKVQWDPPKIRSLKKRPACFSDDDSSDSDSEQSFKRRNISSSPSQRQHKEACAEGVRSSSYSKLDMVPEPRLGKFSNVIRHIQISCDNHKIAEAVELAAEYLKISSKPTCLKIFEEIFLGIRDSVCLTKVDPEDPLKEVIEKLKSFLDSSKLEKREEDIKLCSFVIYEFFRQPVLIGYALDLCSYLQSKEFPIRSRAVEAYANNAISSNAPTHIILEFLAYIKKICRLPFHQSLLKHVLQRVTRGKQCYMLPDFSQLCELLCLLDDYEIERQPLQGLMEICIENNCWDQIARLVIAWSDKKCFPTTFLEVLLLKLDEIGIRFTKFAAAIFGGGEPSKTCKHFFGLIGVSLIMNSCESGQDKDKKTKKVYLVNANNVLHTLHKYNVDIFSVMKSCSQTHLPAVPNPCSVVWLPFSVFFTLVKICLRLKLPKDAFQLFNNYSSYLSELPQVLSDEKKSSIKLMQFKQFVRVTQALHLIDPLESGLSAFHQLISLSKQEDMRFYLEDIFNDWTTSNNINFKAIEIIFTNLLVTFMNKSLVTSLHQLYQYISTPWESILMPRCNVLRGLLVTFAKYDKMEDARSLFTLGCSTSIYIFEKPKGLPWEFTLASNWTSEEMRFVIERYMHLLFPFLSKKKSKTKFEDWFTVKITFKEIPCSPPKISCLIVPPVPSPLSRACSVIKSINPDLTWTEHENYILLEPSSVYTCYIKVCTKNYAELQEKTFNVSQSRPPVFGKNVDSEENLNLSRTPETPAFSSNLSSSSQQSTPSHPQPSNDHRQSLSGFLHPGNIPRRKRSLNSSESSSSHTPECRTSVEGEPPRPELKRTLFKRRGSICKSGQIGNASFSYPESPVSKQRRVDSNFTRASPQQQSQVTIHRSPRKNGLIQSQTLTASHQSSPQIGLNQFEVSQPGNFVCQKISPRQMTQHPTTASYQLPQNTGLNQSQSTTPPLPHSGERFRSPTRQDKTRNNFLVDPHTSSNFMAGSHQLTQSTDLNWSQRTSSFTQSSEMLQSPMRQVTDRENVRVTVPARFDFNNTPTSDCIRQYKNISSRNCLLMSPPSNFTTASPSVSDDLELSLNNVKRNLNVIINSSNENPVQKVTGISKSPLKQKVTRKLNTFSPKISSSQNADSSSNNKVSNSLNRLITSQKNKSSFMPILQEPTTSLTNHSPGLSVFTAPQKPSFKAKRQLNLNYKEPFTPKAPPYRIQTPCKELKVIRRCKTPLTFHSDRPKLSQNFKKPIPTSKTKGTSNTGFEKITVSFGNNSSSRTRKFTPITIESSNTTVKSSSGPSNNRGFSNTMFKWTDIGQPEAVTNVPYNEFQKITTFIQIKVLSKCKSLNNEELQQKVTALANTFVENNAVKQLNSKTMKLLCKFVETIF